MALQSIAAYDSTGERTSVKRLTVDRVRRTVARILELICRSAGQNLDRVATLCSAEERPGSGDDSNQFFALACAIVANAARV